MHSDSLIEVQGLDQSVEYQIYCAVSHADSNMRVTIIAPALVMMTWYGDNLDYYDKSPAAKLGSGGFATVYMGWHLPRPLVANPIRGQHARAIKVFDGTDAKSKWSKEKQLLQLARDRLPDSAKACLVKFWITEHGCKASGQQKSMTYLLPLEYCTKGRLQEQALDHEWALDDKQRSQLQQLFSLVENLHKKDLIHKDLDLVNIMVCDDGTCAASCSASHTATPASRLAAILPNCPLVVMCRQMAADRLWNRQGRFRKLRRHQVRRPQIIRTDGSGARTRG